VRSRIGGAPEVPVASRRRDDGRAARHRARARRHHQRRLESVFGDRHAGRELEVGVTDGVIGRRPDPPRVRRAMILSAATTP
jgi:hypothetical protein